MNTKRIISVLMILVLICGGMLFASCTNKKHNPVVSKVVEPTCLTIGYSEYHCDHCDITYIADFVDALGHSYTEENAVREADCTTRGIYESECERCGLTERRTVDAKGHSYIEISNDGEIASYECEHCYHLLTIGTEEDVKDYIGSVELFDVEASFSFDVLCTENEEYVREHLVLLDSYFIGSEYEYDAMLDYALEEKGNGIWTVSLFEGFEHDTTYLATPTGEVSFAEYKGTELFFTVKDDPNHENVQEYNSEIVFLHNLEQKNGGYYPYAVNAKEGESRIYVTVGKVDGLNKGQVLCVGKITNMSEITSDTECYFGIIDEFYEVADGKWVIVLSAPELQDIFDEFDVAFNKEINLENANINIEQLKADLVDSLYASEEFVEFLSAVNVSANAYLNTNGYHSHNLDTIEKYLNSVHIDPTVKFNNNKLVANLDGEITLDIEDETGKKLGTLCVEFGFDIETKFKIDVNYEIRTSGFLGLNVNLDRFDIAITQSDKIDFDFGVSIDADGFDKVSYAKNKNSGEVHLACCVEVVRAADPSIFEVATADIVKSAGKKCAHCHPTGNESGEDNFKSYYISTLYCSDWSKVAQDIRKLTQVEGDSARADVKLTSVEIPLALGVEIKLDLGFMLSLDPHALLDYSSTFSQTSTYGMRLNHNHLQPYSKTNGGEFRQDELAIVGQAQTKMGLSVDAFVSIKGCEKWFRAGVEADIGAYADVSGVYNSSENYAGAYLEAGTFIDVSAYYKLFKTGDSADVAGATYPLMKYGYEKLYFGYDTYYDSIKILGSFDIDANDLLTVRYYDLVNMVVKNDELSLNERSKYRVNISFADGRYCELRNGVIVYKTGAPEIFNDTLIITVTSNDNWNSYKKGSAVYYIGTYTIDFEFDTNHRHSWVDATCTSPKHCEGCGLKEGKELGHSFTNYVNNNDATCTKNETKTAICDRCTETDTLVINDTAKGHDWQDATCISLKNCKVCGATTGSFASHIESDWIVDKDATSTETGTKHTECTICGIIINQDIVQIKKPSQGLKFMLNPDEQSYSVTGIGSCQDRDIIIPSEYNGLPVTSIGKNAFVGTYLSKVEIPNSVKSIETNAFGRCTYLESITIPSSVTSIGRQAFSGCTSLLSVNISDVVAWTNIDFGNTSSDFSSNPLSQGANLYIKGELVKELIIPDGATTISCGAFYGYKTLTKVILPVSISNIDAYAFYNCTSLMSINIPSSVDNIGNQAFSGCYKLIEVCNKSSLNISVGNSDYGYVGYYAKHIVTNESQSALKTIGDYIFFDNGTDVYLVHYLGDEAELILPDYNGQNYEIWKRAFDDCTLLTSIVLPESVTIIGDYAFNNCTSLASIGIPGSVTSIGNSAFKDCTSLASVEFAENSNLEHIGEHAFYRCSSLTSIVIPYGVTSLYGAVFYECFNLTSITIPNSVTTLSSIPFSRCFALATINYEGTKSEWNAISKPLDQWGRSWNFSIEDCTIYCTNGTAANK